MVDVRRVGHPPLLPFQVLPMPFAVGLGELLEIVHSEIPSLGSHGTMARLPSRLQSVPFT